jgi:hypothetical protein
MKKSMIFFFLVIFAIMVAVSAQAAPTGKQMADRILASNGNGTPTVKTAPASAENYLLKQEKLAEQMGLIARKQSGLEKKISVKVDKKYVDKKLVGLENRLAAVESKQGEIEGSVSTLRSEHDALVSKHVETRKIVDKTVKRVDSTEGTLRYIGSGVLFLVVVVIVIGIFLALIGLRRRSATASATAGAGTGSPTP